MVLRYKLWEWALDVGCASAVGKDGKAFSAAFFAECDADVPSIHRHALSWGTSYDTQITKQEQQ